jgi:hypothetical protein
MPLLPDPLLVLPTRWPKVRVALFKRKDGQYQFFAEILGTGGWDRRDGSGVYANAEEAKQDMIRYAREYQPTTPP